MNPSPLRGSASSVLRVLWVVVALVVGFGAGKAPLVMVLTHSHVHEAGVSHTHHDYRDFLDAGRHSPSPDKQNGGKPHEHSHRIAVQVDAPAVIASVAAADMPEPAPAGSILLAGDDRNGPRRPADLLIRPPQGYLS
ncbi:MAG: hypothetical protein KF712_18135 [Akkermansiaceae bacterium]|nr:hypothetical protein [Akkermansiaceae bacterium]